MDAKPGQFKNWCKTNRKQQKYGSFGECYDCTNLMDYKKNLNETVTRSQHNKITHNTLQLWVFFDHMMRRKTLEHLETTGIIEGKQCEKMLDGLTKWLKEGRVTQALKVTWDRAAWKVT